MTDIPAGMVRPPTDAPSGSTWRVGSHCAKNLYIQDGPEPSKRDLDVGRMDTPALAALVVKAVNALREPPEWPRWGSAADTVCEHASEAEARSYEANTSTVHRWASGPWLTDDGDVWEGDERLGHLQAQIFDLTNRLRSDQ